MIMKDYDDYLKYKKEYEDQEKKDLEESRKKHEETKPPWYKDPVAMSMRGESDDLAETSPEPPADAEKSDNQDFQEYKDGIPIDSLTRYDLYKLRNEGADSDQLAQWRNTLEKSERVKVEKSSIVSGEGVSVIDVVGKEKLFYPHPQQRNMEQIPSDE
jgi:hypothetical protein